MSSLQLIILGFSAFLEVIGLIGVFYYGLETISYMDIEELTAKDALENTFLSKYGIAAMIALVVGIIINFIMVRI